MTLTPTEGPRARSAARGGRWLARGAVVALIGVGLIVALGSDRTSSGPATGRAFVAPRGALTPATPRGRIRLAHFNIHSGRDAAGTFDLERTARELAGFDLVGLNEVRGPEVFQWSDQARQLGDRLGVSALFAPTERQWFRDHFGNGALSRLDIAHWQRIPLPCTRGKGYRCALLVRVAGTPSLRVLITHLDRTTDREEQLRSVIELFLSLEAPAVLMGDLNTRRDDPQLAAVLRRSDVVDAVGSHGGRDSADRIDWILVRGGRVIAGERRESAASDHPLVWAELAVEP